MLRRCGPTAPGREQGRGVDKVATSSYVEVVAELKTVGIKELKNNLSAYLRDVRRGVRVLVSDRNRVVAELHEPRSGYAVDDSMDPRIAEWIDSGVIVPPTAGKTSLPNSPVKLEDGVAARLLDEDRGEAGR